MTQAVVASQTASRLVGSAGDTARQPLPRLRVVVAHNTYQLRGGEDAVVEAEVALLREHGHEVHEYVRRNADIVGMGKATVAAQTIWSRRTVTDIDALLETSRPDVLHVHNTLPLISPSIYWAAARHGVPVVQTLHNFRLICPQAMLLREGKVCEDCVGKLPWRGAVRGCYRESVSQSTVLALAVAGHGAIGTWADKVSRYIALNDFCRGKFIAGGLPAQKVSVKPNFVDLPPPASQARSGFLFVGRLSREKGIDTLAEALVTAGSGLKLEVAGTGPDGHRLEGIAGVGMLGALLPEHVYARMRGATALVIPSIWYENFPRTLVEAFACGLPVIASRIGALAELIEEGRTGLLFEPGNATELGVRLQWANSHPEEMRSMGQRARARYEADLTGPRNYRMLVDIYAQAIREHATSPMKREFDRHTIRVISTPVDVLSWDAAVLRILGWARMRESRYVCICNAHSVVTAEQRQDFSLAVNKADMVTADGESVAWMLRRLGAPGQPRINGPDLMLRVCESAEAAGLSIYLWGSAATTLSKLERALAARYPRLKIAGSASPPYRPMTDEETAEHVAGINQSGASIVFVSLGCPKQEIWMAENRDRIQAVAIGVGAAFDFHADCIRRAPHWMRRNGLEWLHRLVSEPRRLWRRYLVTNTVFVVLAMVQLIRKRP